MPEGNIEALHLSTPEAGLRRPNHFFFRLLSKLKMGNILIKILVAIGLPGCVEAVCNLSGFCGWYLVWSPSFARAPIAAVFNADVECAVDGCNQVTPLTQTALDSCTRTSAPLLLKPRKDSWHL